MNCGLHFGSDRCALVFRRNMLCCLIDSAVTVLRGLESSLGLEDFPKYRQENAGKSEWPFLLVFIIFTLSVYALETYLDLRQHRRLKATSPPSSLLNVLKTVDKDNEGLQATSKVRKILIILVVAIDRSREGCFILVRYVSRTSCA